MLTVEVPLNTMLADLDETLRGLLKGELERHGFEGVDIAFDAPAREWSGQLSKPTVNMFLYDLRESETMRTSEWSRMTKDGRTFEGRPPMVMECSYAVTAYEHSMIIGGRPSNVRPSFCMRDHSEVRIVSASRRS